MAFDEIRPSGLLGKYRAALREGKLSTPGFISRDVVAPYGLELRGRPLDLPGNRRVWRVLDRLDGGKTRNPGRGAGVRWRMRMRPTFVSMTSIGPLMVSAARRGWLICCCIMLLGLGGCTRAVSPPPFKSASSTPVLSFLEAQGPIAAAQRAHLIDVVLLLLIVVVPVLVLTPLVVWRYRLNGSARYTPAWSFFMPLELVIWGIPIAIVITLAVWLWKSTHELDPYAPLASAADPPLQVQVVGYDWKWLFIYPQLNIASIGELAFPAGQPLDISLTSNTVMQSFFIPPLGSQIYAMAGMVTKLHLLANAPGSFRGENTQFNGTGFYLQDFTAKAMTAADFADWVKRVQTAGTPLSDKTYDVIRQRSTLDQTRKALGANADQDGALFFTGVPPNLFDAIVQSFMGSSGQMGAEPRPAAHGSGSHINGD